VVYVLVCDSNFTNVFGFSGAASAHWFLANAAGLHDDQRYMFLAVRACFTSFWSGATLSNLLKIRVCGLRKFVTRILCPDYLNIVAPSRLLLVYHIDAIRGQVNFST
jgi:hypothetical protein